MADFKIGDKVLIIKDGAAAVVTKAASVEGKKQAMVEVCRDDNGSVREYWADEVRLAKAVAPEPASQPQEPSPEPVKEPSASEKRRLAHTDSPSTVAKATRVS